MGQCSPQTAAPPPGAAVFPKLVDLHVQDCGLPLVVLQSIIDAAPRLSTLHLASCYFNTGTNNFTNEVVVGRLLMPAVSDLVLADCTYGYRNNHSLELHVLSLQYFRYKGPVEDTKCLSLKSQASTIHVDLHLTHDHNGYTNGQSPPVCKLFWRFIQNFNTTKHLKVRIDDYYTMDNLALIDEASRDELLGVVCRSALWSSLSLEAEYKPRHTSMILLADLLHCFPMVRDLRIKLTERHEYIWRGHHRIAKEARVHFDRSVGAFRNRRRRRSMVSLAPQNDDNYEAFDIPGLTGGEHSFSFLRGHLKRVRLQFFKDEPNCLGVQLVKFFAQNAMVLRELHIDDGCQEMLEHVNFSIRRWIANTNNQLMVKD